MRIVAAVVQQQGGPFVLTEAELDAPQGDEIVVGIRAAGICATDLHVRDQHLPMPLPAILGHEGAGVVEAVGNDVKGLAVGDHVVLSQLACGQCRECGAAHPAYCARLFELNYAGCREDGTIGVTGTVPGRGPIHGHFFGQSAFATRALATERNAVRVDPGASLELLAPLGCGVQTGAGAVLNSLGVAPDASIVILGTGAVGLAAVMAARVAKATRIIAVDVRDDRLALARELGATHILHTQRDDVESAVRAIVPGGVDYVLEMTSDPSLGALATRLLAPLGVAGLIGTPRPGARLEIDPMTLQSGGKMLRGISQGDAIPQQFIPRLIELHQAGAFPFDRLVRFYPFEDINEAVGDAERGEVIKPVLIMG